MRKNLKLFRVANDMTQSEIAAKIGCARGAYAAIEKGTRGGSQSFWAKLQTAFNIPNEDMWGLIKNEK